MRTFILLGNNKWDSIKEYYEKVIAEKADNREGLFDECSTAICLQCPDGDNQKYALDLGYGYGNDCIWLLNAGYLVDAVDIIDVSIITERMQDLGILTDRVTVIQSDIKDWKFSNIYSVIICKNVLHYLCKENVYKVLSRCIDHSAANAVHIMSVFTNIIRYDFDGKIKKIENEADFTENEFIDMLKQIYDGWDISIDVELYREKAQPFEPYEYYFQAKRVNYVAKRNIGEMPDN